MSNAIDDVVSAWKAYTDTIHDWQELVAGVTPKDTDCGPVYEIPNPIDRPNESFAIADMRNLKITGPHYHVGDETEIYIVLTGTGTVNVGGHESDLHPGFVSVTSPGTAHYTTPTNNLVLAVVNTPPFNPANAVSLTETNTEVGFDAEQYAAAKNAAERSA